MKEEAVTTFGETRGDLGSGAPAGQTAAQAINNRARGAADRLITAAAAATLDKETIEN